MGRDYKDEYEKFQKHKSSYRAKLNKYNRDKGTYGNGDGKDASHENGKISGFVDSSINKGKREKSRMKGSKRNKYKKGGKTPKKGLWANIHAKRKRGESPAKPGDKDYPKTLDIMKEGGKMNGPSHDKGGIPIEVEGGEYVIKKKSVNASTEPYLEYINQHGKLPPSNDARKMRK